MFGRRELERTCKRDGTVWYVPKEMAKKPPTKGQIRGAKVSAFVEQFGRGSANAVQAGNLQNRRDTILGAQRCPECGSTSYTERKVKL